MPTTTGSVPIVQQEDRFAYPDGLNRLPQLLERIDSTRYGLAEMVRQQLDRAEAAEQLWLELAELAEFVGTRIEVNRARERRRVRRRRNGHSNNGHIRAYALGVTAE